MALSHALACGKGYEKKKFLLCKRNRENTAETDVVVGPSGVAPNALVGEVLLMFHILEEKGRRGSKWVTDRQDFTILLRTARGEGTEDKGGRGKALSTG